MKFVARILALGALIVGLTPSGVRAQAPAAPPLATFVAMFTAPFHCPPCEQMKPVVGRLAGNGFPITIIKDAKLAAKIGITAYPTFVGVVKGKIISRAVGVLPEWRVKSLIPAKYWPVEKPDLGPIQKGVNPLPENTSVIFDRPRASFNRMKLQNNLLFIDDFSSC